MKLRFGIRIRKKWRGIRTSRRFQNFVSFLVFVGIATLFWFVVALNDSVVETMDVKLEVVNVPDTVTFISDPPHKIKVTVRDRGTNIVRVALLNTPTLQLNFRDYTSHGVFRFTRNDLTSALKSLYGQSAQISSVSIDSLYLTYSTEPGKRVPVVVKADVTASAGNVLASSPVPLERGVIAYSASGNLDSLHRALTEPIVKRNLAKTTEVEVKLKSIPGVKFVPSVVKVRIPVEPLVRRESMVTVGVINLPSKESLLLFPNKVHVVYYLPMSLYNSDLLPIEVVANYNDIRRGSRRLPISIKRIEDYVVSPELRTDSVEYTIIKE